ncbi:hypothetical protein Tco_1392166 [Tanacetum coccineum]
MRQRRWLNCWQIIDCEIRYHPGKANVVADALSRKEQIKPLRLKPTHSKKKTSRLKTYEEWIKHLKYSDGNSLIKKRGGYRSLKCLSDESLVIPMKELRLDNKLNFEEEPVEIKDRGVKQLKQSHIPIVKVRWNSKRGPEFTWEREDQIHAKYPHLFSNITLASN